MTKFKSNLAKKRTNRVPKILLRKSKTHKLSTHARGAIVYAKATQNLSNRTLSQLFKVSHQAIGKLIKKWKEHQTLEDLPRSGRPRNTSPRQRRVLKRMALLEPRTPFRVHLQRFNEANPENAISVWTLAKILAEFGLYSRICRQKPKLSPKQITHRLRWAKEHAHWTEEDWKKVVWSDEAPFSLRGVCGRQRTIRRVGEAFNKKHVVGTTKHGGGKIQVWSCFGWNGVGKIKWIQGIMCAPDYKHILRYWMKPSMARLQGVMFQQDNDPKHTAKITKKYLADYKTQTGITTIDWPSNSPDLNPIENLWMTLNRIKDAWPIHTKPTNKAALFKRLAESWDEIGLEVLRDLIRSMPRRVKDVIKAKGHHTKY